MSFIAGYLLGRASNRGTSNKLKIISESKVLFTIPVDNVFHLSVHAQYSGEDAMFMEQYNSGYHEINTTAERGSKGGFVYLAYRKCLNLWLVCWKDEIPQYATLLSYASTGDALSEALVYTGINEYYNIVFYSDYKRPIYESIGGSGGGNGFIFDKENQDSQFAFLTCYWDGGAQAVMSFYDENYAYEEPPNNIGIGRLKMLNRTTINIQASVGRFNIVPGFNGTVTNLNFDELKTLVEDLCIAIINANGFKGERLTVLKPD